MMFRKECNVLDLLTVIDPAFDQSALALFADSDVAADIDALVHGFRLQMIRRYFHQVHWREETLSAARADEAEPGLKLENVAAHSWHVADAVLLLGSRFSGLDAYRALQLAVLHDKLEIYTGDFDPVGTDGNGSKTHAFDHTAQARKWESEREALNIYLDSLRGSVRDEQRTLLEENILGLSREARFVKAVDKLQALAFVHEKKRGNLSDEHISFSLRYSYRTIVLFSSLAGHYMYLLNRFISQIAAYRRCECGALIKSIAPKIAIHGKGRIGDVRSQDCTDRKIGGRKE